MAHLGRFLGSRQHVAEPFRAALASLLLALQQASQPIIQTPTDMLGGQRARTRKR